MELVLKQFKESISEDTPTERDKIIAELIIRNLRTLHPVSKRASASQTMFDCAFKWKDVEMWRDLIFGQDVGVQGENGLVRAFRVFKFDQTRPRYIEPRLLLLANGINNILALKSC